MRYFGMKLNAIQFLFFICHGSSGAITGVCNHLESFRRFNNLPCMAHPAGALLFHALQKTLIILNHGDNSTSVFPLQTAFNLSTQQVCHQLHAIADAQYRHAGIKDGRINGRRICVQYACRSSRQDDTQRLFFHDILNRRIVRQYAGVNAALAYTPRNQLCILTAKIQNYDSPLLHRCSSFP